MNDQLQLKISMLPDSPGCYLMKHQGTIIYVGKAVNLKNRVRSYFQSREHTPKVAAMVAQVDDFDVLLCNTNLEALTLECNLIKRHRPHYNILLKDDKHYPYLRLDIKEPWPRLTIARRMARDGALYFGPYIGTGAIRDVLETVRKTFPLRTCSKKLPLSHPERPCVNYQIGRCLAPCAGLCTPEAYREVTDGVAAFLSGDARAILSRLEEEMRSAAASLDYETAARRRDAIRDIGSLMEKQHAIQHNEAQQDVWALYQDGMDAAAQLLIVRGGRMIGGEFFVLSAEGREPPAEVLDAFILQYYADRLPPREMILEVSSDPETLEALMRERRGRAVTVTVPSRGEKRALVLMARKNACDALAKRNARSEIRTRRTRGAVTELAQRIGLREAPHRIEGFDISNTQGALSVASMVVFLDGEPAYKEYRHFRIKTVEGPNDFASMREVLLRRLMRCREEDPTRRWPVPDLILVDGGPQQLAYAREAMRAAGMDIPMIGLAERLEEIWLPDASSPLLLDHHAYALQLLQRVRDESHRFAITYHRALRSREQTHSILDDVPGIGPQRRKALFQRFGTLKAMRAATVEELCTAKGMNRTAAQALHDALQAQSE